MNNTKGSSFNISFLVSLNENTSLLSDDELPKALTPSL